MERREFLKSTAWCGLALAFGGPLTNLRADDFTASPGGHWK